MTDDRQQLADRQAALVRALSTGNPPAGFDADRLALTARTLVNKRRRSVAKQWPRLAETDGFAAQFADYAAAHVQVADDGPAFFHWLGDSATDGARWEQLTARARAGRWATIRLRSGRPVFAIRLGRRIFVLGKRRAT